MRSSLKQFSHRLYEKAFDEDVFSRAASVAFYFSFAFFPLLLFLISLFGLVLDNATELRGELFFYLKQIMPKSAFDLVQATIFEVIVGSTSTTLTIGLVVALWSAAAGFDSLRVALNGVYGLRETRPRWKSALLVLLLTLCIGLFISVALGCIFYGTNILGWLLPFSSPFLLKLLGWITVLISLLIVFTLLYGVLPDHKEHRWKWVAPGSITGICLWLLLSGAFQVYLAFFDTYSATYGSLGAMIILMLWLYLTALVILLGGILNVILSNFSKIKTETD
jgi:membrane protein